MTEPSSADVRAVAELLRRQLLETFDDADGRRVGLLGLLGRMNTLAAWLQDREAQEAKQAAVNAMVVRACTSLKPSDPKKEAT